MTTNVTISAQTTTTKISPNIRFDPTYVKTLSGILKILEVVVCLIGFICVQTIPFAAYRSAGGWYVFVAVTGFWVTLLLFLAYLFHFVERLHWLPWLLVETAYNGTWAVFFFIASCVSAANASTDPGWGAAAFFGFGNMFIFGFDTYLKFKAWRGGEIAQGERTTSPSSDQNTPSATGPSYPTY
ncbi:CKLF-like MARVEL transmembrane domain-containing protein 4, partial [Stegodyphus mimosarum]